MTTADPTEADRAVGYRRILDRIELGADVRDALDRENQEDPEGCMTTIAVRAGLARIRAGAKVVPA
jgi:hypothetical protein